MWIFTNQGFISAVAHRDKPDYLLVRARRREHLEAIFPGYEISQTEQADYRYRILVSREHFAQAVAEEARAIDYPNFKNSIADHEYHDACSGVWSVMHRLQPGSYYRGVTLAHEYADPWGGEDEEYDDDQPDLWDDGSERHRLRSMIGGTLLRCAECGIEMPDAEQPLCADCTPPAF